MPYYYNDRPERRGSYTREYHEESDVYRTYSYSRPVSSPIAYVPRDAYSQDRSASRTQQHKELSRSYSNEGKYTTSPTKYDMPVSDYRPLNDRYYVQDYRPSERYEVAVPEKRSTNGPEGYYEKTVTSKVLNPQREVAETQEWYYNSDGLYKDKLSQRIGDWERIRKTEQLDGEAPQSLEEFIGMNEEDRRCFRDQFAREARYLPPHFEYVEDRPRSRARSVPSRAAVRDYSDSYHEERVNNHTSRTHSYQPNCVPGYVEGQPTNFAVGPNAFGGVTGYDVPQKEIRYDFRDRGCLPEPRIPHSELPPINQMPKQCRIGARDYREADKEYFIGQDQCRWDEAHQRAREYFENNNNRRNYIHEEERDFEEEDYEMRYYPHEYYRHSEKQRRWWDDEEEEQPKKQSWIRRLFCARED